MANESNFRAGFNSGGNSDVRGQLTVTGGGASVPAIITGATNTILELRDQSSGDVLSVFKSDGTELFKVKTDGITVGGSYTLPLTDGTANQVLQTDGAGAATFTTLNTSVRSLDGVASEALTEGDPVYIDSETAGVPNFSKAKQTLSPYKVPVGIAATTVSASATVTVITFGVAEDLDTSSFTAGDILYVGLSGGLSTSVNVANSGSTKVGTVVSSNATTGKVLIDCGTFNENSIDLQYVTERGDVTDDSIDIKFVRANTESSNSIRTIGAYINKDFTQAPVDGAEGAGIAFGLSTTTSPFTPFTHAAITPYLITAGTTSTAVGGLRFSTYNGSSFEDTGLRVHEKTITVGDTDTFTFPVGDGTSGQTLVTDGSGQLSWDDASGGSTVIVDVHNDSGATITKGTPVYISGEHASGKPTIAEALNTSSSTMPAAGLVQADVTNNTDGKILVSGVLTSLDTSSFTAGDALYVDSTAGALTATRPTIEAHLVQKVGVVTRSHASSGEILVMGANRTNDIPNNLELNTLTDVTITGTPSNGDTLLYNTIGGVFEAGAPTTPNLQSVTDQGSSTTATLVAGNYTTTGNVTAIGTGNNTFTGNINANGGMTITDTDLTQGLTIKSTDSTADAWGALTIFRSSSSPADDDVMSNINFNGEDSSGTDTTYASIQAVLRDPTGATEDGGLNFRVKTNNTWNNAIQINADDASPRTTINNFSGVGTALELVNTGGSSSLAFRLDADAKTTSTNTATMQYVDAAGDVRNFIMVEDAKTIINNRTANSDVEIRANSASGGSGGEVTYITVDGSAGKIGFHNNAYLFPTSDGSANQVLQTDGSGNLSFADAGSSNRKFYEHQSVTNIVGTSEDNYYWYPGGLAQGIRDDYGTENASGSALNWNQVRRTGFQLPAGTYSIDLSLRLAISGNSTGTSSNGAFDGEDVDMYLYKVSKSGVNSTFWSQVGSTQYITIGSNTYQAVTASVSATSISIGADEVLIPVLKGNTNATTTAYALWDYTLDCEKTA